MSFITDKQTLDDLLIFTQRGQPSVYALFNHTRTRGGAELLEQMFRYPLQDMAAINARSRLIQYFREQDIPFPFSAEAFDAAEPYLANTDSRHRLTADHASTEQKLKRMMGADTEYALLLQGMEGLVSLLHAARTFAALHAAVLPEMATLLVLPAWAPVWETTPGKKLPFEKAAALDNLLRYAERERLLQLLHQLYRVDVYQTVAQVAAHRHFVFPEALPATAHRISITGLYHPLLEAPVANDIRIAPGGNIVFLTGANMAGKSTFMKSLGIAVFLAHMGFPVPAQHMEFAVRDGLLTTINLADNLNMGISHFYAEVLRVKKMAGLVKQGQHVFIIFDELFRGTNVKDAYEATVAITGGFASKPDNMFVVSTHIMEAGETLRAQYENIHFVYLPTRMRDHKPEYTYKLENGISDDRHGMIIIQNEHILDTLKNGNL